MTKGKPGCPKCGGRGVILDADPMAPARICNCTVEAETDGASLGIPSRYRQASFESFWEWWKIQHPRDKVIKSLDEAQQLVEHQTEAGLAERMELRSKLDLILHKCGARPGTGESSWKDLKPAQEPLGYRTLFNWVRHGRESVDLWWIDGPSGSGRSTLAAAALKGWAERTGARGLFISMRTFSQELKDTYYDSRSFRNTDFISERDRMAPLLEAPCLVLDDLDRIDTDIRVVRAVGQLLDQRYADERPTILTASRWAEMLQVGENYPFARLEDPSLLRRLAQSRRVQMKPILERLMESLNG
jgi:hypothetical protein